MMSKNAARYRLRHRYREDLGTKLSCFGCEKKKADISLVSGVRTTAGTRQNNSKNMEKTARRQLGGRHLLFEEYLRSRTNLNVHYRR